MRICAKSLPALAFLHQNSCPCGIAEQSAWKKRYEPARTAYQRLMDAGVLGRRARRELRERYESLDPFVLKADVERRLHPILAGAAPAGRSPATGGD